MLVSFFTHNKQALVSLLKLIMLGNHCHWEGLSDIWLSLMDAWKNLPIRPRLGPYCQLGRAVNYRPLLGIAIFIPFMISPLREGMTLNSKNKFLYLLSKYTSCWSTIKSLDSLTKTIYQYTFSTNWYPGLPSNWNLRLVDE